MRPLGALLFAVAAALAVTTAVLRVASLRTRERIEALHQECRALSIELRSMAAAQRSERSPARLRALIGDFVAAMASRSDR